MNGVVAQRRPTRAGGEFAKVGPGKDASRMPVGEGQVQPVAAEDARADDGLVVVDMEAIDDPVAGAPGAPARPAQRGRRKGCGTAIGPGKRHGAPVTGKAYPFGRNLDDPVQMRLR